MESSTHYCDHFKNLKISKSIHVDKWASCKFCSLTKSSLWFCLAKGCESYFCDKNNSQHMSSHLQDSRHKKSYHSCFINISTAMIVCISCKIEILDLDRIKGQTQLQDPYSVRVKVLPSLQYLSKFRINGQIQNPEGHRKYSKNMVGLFGTKYNNIINSAIQFFAHCSYFRDLLLEMKIQEQNKFLTALHKIVTKMLDAQFRAIRSDQITQIIIQKKPELYGYKRKDPFDILIMILNNIHNELKSYVLSPQLKQLDEQIDEWDALCRMKDIVVHSPIFDFIGLNLSLNYYCPKCQKKHSSVQKLDFMKLSFPKKRKKVREIQKQLEDHRYGSPVKNRRNSLLNLLLPTQPECPFTIPQLIIEYLKSNHVDKLCAHCGTQMKKQKLHIDHFSQLLIIQINRMNKDGSTIQQQVLQPEIGTLDLGSFTGDANSSVIYEFQSAICIEKQCLFPVIAKNQLNKQLYSFKNELVEVIKQPMNPYILCYRKVVNKNQISLYNNVMSSIQCQINPQILLPDFWLVQLKHGRQQPLNQQLVCKHGRIKPYVKTKMQNQQKIPPQIFDALFEKYGGKKYSDKICKQCQDEVEQLEARRTKQKESINNYDRFKSTTNCMVAAKWIKRWSDYLYNKKSLGYFSKGYPLPGPIDNKPLLDGQKCKPDLKKNDDFKIVNVYIWRFLKQVYGGGPQIRYKWKQNEMSNKLDEELLRQIKIRAGQIKDLYNYSFIEYSKRSFFVEKSTSYMQDATQQKQEQQLSQ